MFVQHVEAHFFKKKREGERLRLFIIFILQKEDDEPEYKFEWQRKYNAPREDYAKGNTDIKDQPFGIPVRNVRCIKCHKWGHINTDKECPLYSQASTSSMPTTAMDPMELMKQMREDGYGLKENVLGHHLNPQAVNQQFIPSDESDPEAEFLKSLSTADKKKLLRKLKKLSKKHAKSKKKKSKKHKAKAKDSSDSDSNDKKKKKKKHSYKDSSSSSSEASSDENTERNSKKHKSNSHYKEEKRKKQPEETDSEDNGNVKKTKRSKHHTQEKLDEEFSRKAHTLKKNESLRPDQSEKEKYESSNKREYEEPKKTKRSSYLSSSSENEEQNNKQKTGTKSCKHKDDEDDFEPQTTKRIKTEKDHWRNDTDESESKTTEQKNEKPEHPDGFSHICPQAKIEANYIQPEEEYQGKVHDRFRHLYRDKRSPSVKQKYNK
ncbi:corepressor interacting with RBPJ 1-like isoform X1 [Argiope bruennichi]|uniref:corepressor interacting with RBPJ 1-like isoform X1 n=1 Tax=Argiope bruennichi TaxID=94029 RepID=UPI002493ED4D|nr:corepressor interacting with RBPJ 1-like isoform X1 [Argiope bruennichi]